MTDAKQIPAPPQVTAVVVRSGVFEAIIGGDKGIEISSIGRQGGRTKRLALTAVEATQLLDLVQHGRHVLEGMSR